MDNIPEMLFRVFVGFAVLLILIRIIGNKQLGQMNVFTYISGIVIGSMVADIILHNDISLWISMFGVIFWVGLMIGIEIISLKSVRARELLDGQPVILVKKGQIMYTSLKKERLNIDDLTMMLRTNKVFSLAEVEYAILEPNGDLSILKKQEKESVTREDMNITVKAQNNIPTAIIMDGCVIEKNLTEMGLSKQWLYNEIEKLNINVIKDIMYAELQQDGQRLYVQLKNGNIRQT